MRIALWQHCLAFALMAADMAIRAWRSQLLLPMPFRRALVVNTCADAISAVTPARVGGDPLRYVALRRAGHSPLAIVTLCGSEIVADAVALVLIALLLSFRFPDVERHFAVSLVSIVRSGWWWVAGVGVLGVMSALLTRRYLSRHLGSLRTTLRGAWREARTRGSGVMITATALTALALLARCAILPVLLAGVPGLTTGQAILGSAALVYGQQLAPTPAGVGAVEIGAVAGLGGSIHPSALALVLVVWRTYTLVLGSLAGALLLYSYRRASMGSRLAA
ncbi:MAG TPA: lysylphosphatidylglycerol synthase domain-containing protein [Gemmatimonadales bacterium]|nr:lysylphosphatidylglycerol synthase domain-containing protein [Gemmatimonadales bacterium]